MKNFAVMVMGTPWGMPRVIGPFASVKAAEDYISQQGYEARFMQSLIMEGPAELGIEDYRRVS